MSGCVPQPWLYSIDWTSFHTASLCHQTQCSKKDNIKITTFYTRYLLCRSYLWFSGDLNEIKFFFYGNYRPSYIQQYFNGKMKDNNTFHFKLCYYLHFGTRCCVLITNISIVSMFPSANFFIFQKNWSI